MFISKQEYSKDGINYNEYYLFGKILYLKKENGNNYRKTYLFNICISAQNYKNIVNTINLEKLFCTVNDIDKNHKIDIIIPIYNGYDYLINLFENIKNNTDLDYKIIAINDNSPDSRIMPLLEHYKNIFNSKMRIVNNEQNLGFVKTINKGLELSSEDVVILNTDVILPKNWASKLLTPIIQNEKIGTVTPFSNNATIFSLPENCKDNEFEYDLEQVNQSLSKINNNPENIKFPIGVGFCMAIRKEAVHKVGKLDEIFEKGYGEENDWCQRAIKKGYFNAIAPNLFVWHKSGGSFNTKEKQELINNHLNIIKYRYPKYFKDIKKIIHNREYLSLHFWSELLFLNAISDTQIWFNHSWGGGTETYFFNKIKTLKNNNLIISIQNKKTSKYCISYYYQNYTNTIIVNSFDDIKTIINQLKYNLFVINNLASYKNNIFKVLDFLEQIKSKTNVKISYRGHDFQCICPTITMVNSKFEYCGCKNITNCPECIKQIKKIPIKTGYTIQDWQTKWFHFINEVADEIIVFSESSKEIFLNFYPDIENKLIVIPHSITPLRKVKIPEHKTVNIGVLGQIYIEKGALILKEIDALLPKYKNIKVKVIGTIINNKIKKEIKNIKIIGKYEVENLPDIIEKEQIDIILIPSVCPETFSYTISEAISMDIPIACFNLGAQAERLKKYKKGLILSEINAEKVLDEICLFLNSNKLISTDKALSETNC